MAAKGESKQGLIITLVFFILAAIILGVTTYTGYDGQKTFEAQAKDAKAAEKKALDSRDWEKFQNLAFKAYAGHLSATNKEEQEDLARLRTDFEGTRFNGEKNKDEIAKLVAQLDAAVVPGWNAGTRAVKKPYVGRIKDLETELTEKTKALAELDEGNKAAVARLEGQIKTKDAEIKALQSTLAKAKTDATADLSKYVNQIAQQQKDLDAMGVAKEELAKTSEKDKNSLQAQITALTKERDRAVQNEVKTRDKLENLQQVDLVAKDQPKGKVVSITTSGYPVIDLGSADRIKPQLTFNVVGAGPDGRPQKERKATLEVMNILSEHRSLAHVTGLVDANRNPIVPGDLLFNAAWTPNVKQHVAISGIIDLQSAGSTSSEVQMRNLKEFMRSLEAQNMVIDAYVDLKTMKIEGEVTRQTDYLIVGDIIESRSAIGKEGDGKDTRSSKLSAQMTELNKTAIQNAVTVIPLRKFLAATGYRTPRGSVDIFTGDTRPK